MKTKKTLTVYAIAIVLGILTGIVGSCFQLVIIIVNHGISELMINLSSYPWLHFLTPILLSVIFVYSAWYLVKKFAPEAAGSGVQEIEGALLHQRPIYWRRLLPVKFIGGTLAICGNMVVGREGPTIQMGGNLGEMLGELSTISRSRRDTLIAAGAAAGLATAFNAPLAGVLLVMEEMRHQFRFNFTNFKIVAISCVMATITSHLLIGSNPAIAMDIFVQPNLQSLGLFFLLGIFIGFAGLVFNKTLMQSLAYKDKLSLTQSKIYVVFVAVLIGWLSAYYPKWVGGGYTIIEQSLSLMPTVTFLGVSLVIRFVLTLLCYSTGVPGGVFAPMLALGTLLGLAGYYVLTYLMPTVTIHAGMFAIAGMGGLFSAAVRAPITGIILVVEMTQNYSLILPLMVTCLTSTTIVQLANNEPIYTQLLRRTLKIQHQQSRTKN